jgi:ribose/xylose/arabinose/galactoside ABC-type transport system permease subunit
MNRRSSWRWWDRYGLLVLLAVSVVTVSALQPRFRSGYTALNLLSASAPVAIAGAGMTLAITAGVFDLSVGALLALVSVTIGLTMPALGVPGAMAAGLLVGGLAGLFNGLIVTRLRIQAFIATLGTMLVWRGLALWVSDGKDINLVHEPAVKALSNWLWLAAAVAIVYGVSAWILYGMPLGMRIRATGSNASSAWVSGVNPAAITRFVFVYAGLTAALAAAVTTSQLAIGGCNLGVAFELEAITVTLLGGTALRGGRGRLGGTLAATALLGVMRIALDLANVKDEYQRLAIGLFLIAALALDGLRPERRTVR